MISNNVKFHWLLTDQSDSEINGEKIRAHRFGSLVTDPLLGHSIFIGYRLTNGVAHETEVRFGFSMLDYLLTLVPGKKTRLQGSTQKSMS
jgi:hypothetical protein